MLRDFEDQRVGAVLRFKRGQDRRQFAGKDHVDDGADDLADRAVGGAGCGSFGGGLLDGLGFGCGGHVHFLVFKVVATVLPHQRSWCRYSASAPAIISISSVVIAAWRLRLYWMVSLLISSPALRVALSMAVIDAPCSEAEFSSSAPKICVFR